MVTDDQIAFYRVNGFVHIPSLLSTEEALQFREIALKHAVDFPPLADSQIFDQHVNTWTLNPEMARLTFHPKIASAAKELAGVALRYWHDQILIKRRHNNVATEFHQDQPYWPHLESPNPISCWIALGDVPVERGCMTFLPGSQSRTDLSMQNLSDSNSLFNICPEFTWSPRMTVPLRAGDVTFHHGRCAHMATPNFTNEDRVAHVVIFMDAATRYSGQGHVVTDPLGLTKDAVIEGDLFPLA